VVVAQPAVGDEGVGVGGVGVEVAGVGQQRDRGVPLAADVGGQHRARLRPGRPGGGEQGVVVAVDGHADGVAGAPPDGGLGGELHPHGSAGDVGVDEGQALAEGGAQPPGAVGQVGGDGPVAVAGDPGRGGVETLHAQDQVGGVGVLVLQPVGDDLGGGGVADLQAVRAGLEGERVGVEVLAVGVVGAAVEEQRGPPVVGGDRLVEVVGDLRDDGGAGDVAGA